jgi:hypothetical protein
MPFLNQQRIVWLAASAVAALIGLSSFWLPRPLPGTAPLVLFSAGRALEHIKAIAQKPHPTGSTENSKVRIYLLNTMRDLGLKPLELSAEKGGAKVVNLYGRLEGSVTTNNPQILLICHYDSTPNGPAASDDAAGVATCLESVRALKARGPVHNTLGILITDGEELPGVLLGAESFVQSQPDIMRDLRLVVNLEARGNRGPVLMFQTGNDNNGLIQFFSRACPFPVTASFSEEVYRRMPNDTDFTEFLKAGKRGFNFAFVGGIEYYHSPNDTPENLSLRTLQHYGDCVLPLAQHLGQASSETLEQCLRPGDATFFTLWRGQLIHYGAWWARMLCWLSATVFIVVLGIGFSRSALRLRYFAASLGIGLVTLTASTAMGVGLLLILKKVFKPQVDGPFVIGLPFDSGFMILLLLAAAVATIGVRNWLLRRTNCAESLAGSLVLWVGLVLLSNATLPGAAYLFMWPALFGTISLLMLYRTPSITQTFFAAVPASLLLAPTIVLMHQAITIGILPLFSLLTSLAFCLMPLASKRVNAAQ